MEKKTIALLVFGILVAIGFLVVYVATPRAVFGPYLTGLIGTNANSPINGNIQHCSVNSEPIVNQERLKGASSIKAEDNNIRLTLFVDKATVTEFEDQTFFVEVQNKGLRPLIFPEVYGDPYTITGYNNTGYVFFRLGGENQYSGYYNENYIPPKKPACFINEGESATFSVSTRIGTKNHESSTIAYVAASVKYSANDGKVKKLQTPNNDVPADNYTSQYIDITNHSSHLLKLIVNPADLHKMKSYFDVGLTLPYPPKMGEEQPLFVIARSQYYVGPYTVDVRLPQGLQAVCGKTEVQGDFPSQSYIDINNKPVSPLVEQVSSVIRVKPEQAGNYTIQATIYSVFNGTRVGTNDTIWLSVANNGTSHVSRTELPNSVQPSAKFGSLVNSEIIQDLDPLPRIKITAQSSPGEKMIYHDPVNVDFSWPDGINWMQKMPKSIFATVNPAYVPYLNTSPKENNATLSVKNGTTVKISVANAAQPPSLLVIDLYSHQDISVEPNNGNQYGSCLIYSPTDINRYSNSYSQCPIERSIVERNTTADFISSRHPTQNEKRDYSYDFIVATKKPGSYTMYVYAQWASNDEIRLNDKYRTVNSQFRLQIENPSASGNQNSGGMVSIP